MKVECPHCNQEIEIEVPSTVRRGALAGLALEEMTDEQLKKELTNAKSVLYKAEKRGASVEVIAKNKDRVDAAEAEKAKRDALKKEAAGEVASTEEVTDLEAADSEETVYAEDTEM